MTDTIERDDHGFNAHDMQATEDQERARYMANMKLLKLEDGLGQLAEWPCLVMALSNPGNDLAESARRALFSNAMDMAALGAELKGYANDVRRHFNTIGM